MKILDVITRKVRKFVNIDHIYRSTFTSIIYIVDLQVKIIDRLRNLDVDYAEFGYTNADLELLHCPNSMWYLISTMHILKKLYLDNVDFDTASEFVIENGGVIKELTIDQFEAHLARINTINVL